MSKITVEVAYDHVSSGYGTRRPDGSGWVGFDPKKHSIPADAPRRDTGDDPRRMTPGGWVYTYVRVW